MASAENPRSKAIFESLNQDIWSLSQLIDVFAEIYSVEENFNRMREAGAGPFFGFLVGLLVDALILKAARLLDPAGSGTRENLSLETLISQPDVVNKLGDDPDVALARLRAEYENIRKRRHKRVVHRDMRAWEFSEVPEVSLKDFRQFLNDVSALMGSVSKALWNEEVVYAKVVGATDPVRGLMGLVEEGFLWRELSRKAALKAIDPSPLHQWLGAIPRGADELERLDRYEPVLRLSAMVKG